MTATFLSPQRRNELVRTQQSLGHVPVGGVGHNKGPLQILAEATSWTLRTALRAPSSWPAPGPGLAHTRTARANAGAEPRGEGLGQLWPGCKAEGGAPGDSLAQPAIRALCWVLSRDGPELALPGRGLSSHCPGASPGEDWLGGLSPAWPHHDPVSLPGYQPQSRPCSSTGHLC